VLSVKWLEVVDVVEVVRGESRAHKILHWLFEVKHSELTMLITVGIKAFCAWLLEASAAH